MIAAAIPRAFEDRGAVLALAYLTMQVGRDLFMLWVLWRHDRNNWRNFLRITIWHLYSWPFWIAGAFTDANTRLALWAIAVGIESFGPPSGFYVPGLGRSTTADWNVEGAHMAERCSLFVIIALGESILITGATAAGLPWNAENGAAFVIAFVGSVAMWAVYFNIGAERASRLIASSDDPGRLARSGYTYIHILIVAGIILTAVGDELVLQHPSGHASAGAVATIVGGPALYLAGNALFKRLSAPYLPLSHLVGLGLLALLVPAGLYVSPLALAAGATARAHHRRHLGMDVAAAAARRRERVVTERLAAAARCCSDSQKRKRNMDKDRVEGSWEQAKGKVKEVAGKVTGDAKTEAEGKAQKTAGKIQNAVGGLKDTLRGDK